MPVKVLEQATQSSITLPVAISIAALVLSVLSPVTSSLITGWFRLKEKRLDIKASADIRKQEFYEQHRAEVIEKYIVATGAVAKRPTDETIEKFGATMGEMYLYVDQSLWVYLDAISKKVTDFGVDDPTKELEALCKALNNNVRTKE